jgi:hypothetical protein
MTPENTWDSASVATQVDPVPAPVEAAPVAPSPIPEAEAPTLEKPEAPQIEAEPVAVRESESQEPIAEPVKETPKADEYVAEADDPPEIAALSTAAAKRWAKRQYQDARAVHTFLDFEKPIQEFGDDLFSRSKSRYTEHVIDIFKRHSPEVLGIPFDEAKSRQQPNGQPATITPPPAQTAKPADLSSPLTPEQINQMSDEQLAQRFQEVVSAQEQEKQRIAAEFQAKVDTLQKQFDAVNGKVTTHEQQAQQAEISQKQTELYNNVWSVVDEVIRDSGLEAQPNDPPKIANLKEAARDILSKHNIEAAFDAVDENTKLVSYVFEATKRREFQNAFREEDNLKVRARAAAESVKASAKVQAILSEIEAYANQSKGNSRAANPIPPAPGSSVGVQVAQPTTWDEAEKAA